jgi:hypothetical protein
MTKDEFTNKSVLSLGYSVNWIYKQIDSTYIECWQTNLLTDQFGVWKQIKINLQTDQFRFKDKRNELTNRAVQFNSDADAIKDEHTCRSVQGYR